MNETGAKLVQVNDLSFNSEMFSQSQKVKKPILIFKKY